MLALQGSSTAGTAIINLDDSYLAVNGSGATFGNAKITASNGLKVHITTGSGGQAEFTPRRRYEPTDTSNGWRYWLHRRHRGAGEPQFSAAHRRQQQLVDEFRRLDLRQRIDRKGRDGTWTLSGANTYNGSTTIKGGTLSVATNANLGAAGGGVLIDGGTLRFTTPAGLQQDHHPRRGGGTIEASVVAPNVSRFTGTGALTKVGTGLLVITTVADYSGATHLQAGGLAGQLSSASAYTVDSGTLLSINGNRTIASLAGAGDVTANSGSDVNLTVGGNNTSTTFSGTFNNYPGTPSARLSLTKVGSGTMTLTSTGNYSGGVAINDGVLSISSDANLGAAAGTLAFGGGVLRTTADITMSRATTLNLRGLFDVATGTTLTQNGVIGGADGITKSGGGTLVLGAANTYGGQTTIEGGTLALSGAGSIVTRASSCSRPLVRPSISPPPAATGRSGI